MAASGTISLATMACSDPPTMGTGLSADGRSPDETCAAEVASHAEARLLTRSEYRRTVQDLLGTDLDPTTSFPSEPVVGGFENDASSHQANPLLVEKHAEAAALLAADVLERGIDTLHPCDEELSASQCVTSFIARFGVRAYRRPLTASEHDSFQSLYNRGLPTLGHEGALGTIVEVALQSPQFLYRVEAPISASNSRLVQLGPYEMASRLSYFFWGTMPDDELLARAGTGELNTEDQIEAQARRLLLDEKAESRLREFHRQWLGLSRLSSIARDDAPSGAKASWEEATLRYLDAIVWGETPTVREIFSSPLFYYDDSLAELYGMAETGGWSSTANEAERHGLLTQPGIMALFAHSDQSSPIQRGVFVRENVLCEEVQPPPPTVNNNPPDPDPNLTTRERFAVHTEIPACANCHRLIDPLGFGFENYDHLGRFRTHENALPVDVSGEIVEMEEDALEGPFEDPAEMALRIAESETALTCLARKWFGFAMGRTHNEGDSCSIEDSVVAAAAVDGDVRELLIGLAKSPAFRFRPAHESDMIAEAP